jgi:DNA-directed RNA polymerase specialized sigma24 family protein
MNSEPLTVITQVRRGPTNGPADQLRAGAAAARDPGPPPLGGDAPAVPRPLAELLLAMQSDDEAVVNAAWGECYARYYKVVWSYALFVLSGVAALAEPGEEAKDLASRVLGELPRDARGFRDYGSPGEAEAWLKLLTVRKAKRRFEKLTGLWRSGRSRRDDAHRATSPGGRRVVRLDETPEEIVARLDAIDRHELLELERRLDELRRSPESRHRNWSALVELVRQGYGHRAIGERLGITAGTAANWLSEVYKYLRQPRDRR